VKENRAKTTYPWTAMGYTYNCNLLQDGRDPLLGLDPLTTSSFFGAIEFIVSAGSKIVNDRFRPNAEFEVWVVPEPSAWVIINVGLSGISVKTHRQRSKSGHPLSQPPIQATKTS
jgi:hypothetical protein